MSDIFRLRPAGAADEADLWQWRNDPDTRAASAERAEVPWETHRAWFAAALENPRRRILIAEDGAGKIGMLRFDSDGKGCAEVSINLAPARRGRGLGVRLLLEAAHLLAAQGIARAHARVRADNPASASAFERAGFRLESEAAGWRRYLLEIAGVGEKA